MTKEELAISLLTQVNEILVHSNSWLENTHEPLNMAFDMAIKAIKQKSCWEELIKCINSISSVKPQEPTEWQQDHEILKAYSDGANEMLDKIRAEIMSLTDGDTPERIWNVDVLEIIDKYKTESEG